MCWGCQLAVGHSEGGEWSEGGGTGALQLAVGNSEGGEWSEGGGAGGSSWQLGIVRGVSGVREGVPGVPTGSWE